MVAPVVTENPTTCRMTFELKVLKFQTCTPCLLAKFNDSVWNKCKRWRLKHSRGVSVSKDLPVTALSEKDNKLSRLVHLKGICKCLDSIAGASHHSLCKSSPFNINARMSSLSCPKIYRIWNIQNATLTHACHSRCTYLFLFQHT